VNDLNSQEGPLSKLIPTAGVLGVVGGVAVATSYLLHPSSASPETVASMLWIWVHVGFMVSLVAGIFLLMALLSQYFRCGGGITGFIGFAMSVISLVFVFGLDYSEVFIFPTLAAEFPEVVLRYGDGTMMPSVAFAFPATGAMFMFGFVLFGWQLYRTNTVSKWAALLMIVGTIVFGIGLSGFVPMLVVRAGAVIFGGGLAWVGICLWSTRQTKA
jgi:hypothetical protein